LIPSVLVTLLLFSPGLLAAAPTASAGLPVDAAELCSPGVFGSTAYRECLVEPVAPSDAGGPELPPLVGACTQLTDAWCEGAACVGISYQVPQCVQRIHTPCATPKSCLEEVCRSLCPPRDGEQVPAGGPPACMDVYWKREAGPVTVESRSSCHVEVYYEGRPILQ
jgi:hypothetical protein